MKTNSKEESAKDWFWKGRFIDRPVFHLKDGIYFVREKDRSVTVIKVQFFPETNMVPDTECEWNPRVDFEFNVPTLEWCSVIAAVSKQGANADSYDEAKKLHM